LKIILATKNPGKLKELRELLKNLPIEVISLEGFPDIPKLEETEDTFKGNALKKARFVSEYTGITALADDSGLEVDILDKRPGIYSARYAGNNASDLENNRKLLNALKGTPIRNRNARFICVLAFVTQSGKELTFGGVCDGAIGLEMKGKGGFGYDSIFYLPEFDKTMAELTPEEKNSISHRGKALIKFKNVFHIGS
jgi:XTP/dITP diphosphohydrolase